MSIRRPYVNWEALTEKYPLGVEKMRERYGHGFGLVHLRDLYDRFDELGIIIGMGASLYGNLITWQIVCRQPGMLDATGLAANRFDAEVEAFTEAVRILHEKLVADGVEAA